MEEEMLATYNYGPFSAVGTMEFYHLREWIAADDITVQNKERCLIYQ